MRGEMFFEPSEESRDGHDGNQEETSGDQQDTWPHRWHLGGLQVMLLEDSCYTRSGTDIEERGGRREHYGSARRMSSVWIKMVQEERAHSHGQTESPLQRVRPRL